MYHIVCPAKYRRAVFGKNVDEVLKSVCLDISKRYDIEFIEIGVDRDHILRCTPLSRQFFRDFLGDFVSRKFIHLLG